MEEPIRILQMIGSLSVGGSQSVILNIYRNIDRDKVQFDFVLDHPENNILVPEVTALGASIYTVPAFNGSNLLMVIRAWGKIFKEHPEYKILHSHVRSYAFIYLLIAKKYGIKTIIHSHSTSNGQGITAIVKNILQLPLRFVADYFIGCSFAAGKWLFGSRIVHSDRFHILQNAIKVSDYAFDKDVRERYREELGVGDNITFIHIGRLTEPKNHMFLLKIFSEWLEKNAGYLVIVGDGGLRTQIQKEIERLKIADNVIMLGNRNDIAQLLQAADCLLFPSLYEGLPVTVVEAQAAGIPSLISDVITDEVCLSDLVIKCPIDSGTRPWLDAIEKIDYTRINVSNKIIDAGFDIAASVTWLTDLYRRLSNSDI